MVLRQAGGGSEGRKILWTVVCDGERCDIVGPSLLDNFQHCGGCIGKDGSVGILRT